MRVDNEKIIEDKLQSNRNKNERSTEEHRIELNWYWLNNRDKQAFRKVFDERGRKWMLISSSTINKELCVCVCVCAPLLCGFWWWGEWRWWWWRWLCWLCWCLDTSSITMQISDGAVPCCTNRPKTKIDSIHSLFALPLPAPSPADLSRILDYRLIAVNR